MIKSITIEIPDNWMCRVCSTMAIPKWTINFPWDIYCSEHCRERHDFLKINPQEVDERTFKFWTDYGKKYRKKWILQTPQKFGLSDVIKQAQRLKPKKTGSKVAQKEAQKRGSPPPYVRGEPLSLEPIFKNELEPVLKKVDNSYYAQT